MLEEVEDALPRVAIMANEISKANNEVNELNAMIGELKEEIIVSKMEICKWKLCFKVCLVWLCLITIVMVYILFGQSNGNKFVVSL